MSLKRTFLLLAVAAAGSSLGACSGKKTTAEQNAEKVKAFQQTQLAKSAKYYQEIVDTFPDSPFAAQAKEKLKSIGPVATPKPATPKKK